MNRFLLTIIASMIFCPAFSADRSDKIKPKWMHSLPVPSNQTFIYTIERAMGKSLSDAREDCLNGLLQDAGFEKGVSVTSDYKTIEEEHSVIVDGHHHDTTASHFTANSIVKGKNVELSGVKIDEYWEQHDDGKYYLTTLYARSQIDAIPSFDQIRLTASYGCRGLWRSAIVPGWGQFYKGSVLKGSLVLGGSAVLAAGIVYTECMRADYAKKTHKAENKRTYATRRDNFAMGRNICIGALSALYVYNLIDAIVAPGARRVVLAKHGRGGRSISWSPLIMDNTSPGVVALVTF